MTVLVDTSVWSLAVRRAAPGEVPEVAHLRHVLAGADVVVSTGLILQELLQGFVPSPAHTRIAERFASVPLIVPTRDDHVGAADLRNDCRRAGVQLGTIDALLAALCLRHDLTLLSTDRDFLHAAQHCDLRLWPH